jgi:site-specific DNA recombinase
VVVHSFSRFFRDHFELAFHVRKLAKNGVRLVSITQEMRDDSMHVMVPQIMALFDEYHSKENAKHVIRALKENAGQVIDASIFRNVAEPTRHTVLPD